ncbi:MAG: hypothetical protein KBB37_07655 [Bacteroidia bacterium]|nr:hypothetical protein [Bacteroidia bacterium]MBP7261146.1 hypothetical protein [Bacteroidia bacterium]MBP9180554.1 hypothetical protein [Bacteroidia bacterium]MBP9724875.1 hypothetical protein [Bacteroidia bacterium]
MINKNVVLLFSVIIFSSGIQCNLFEDEREEQIKKLPPATSIGANTIGCLFNDKAWPLMPDLLDLYTLEDIRYSNGELAIGFHTKESVWSVSYNAGIFMRTKMIRTPGFYYLSFSDPSINYFSVKKPDGREGESYYSRDKSNKDGFATVNITRFDTVYQPGITKRVVSGTFNFWLKSENGKSTVKVQEGRFDFSGF